MGVVLGVQFQRHGTLHLLRAEPGQGYRIGDVVRYPAEGGMLLATIAWIGECAAEQSVPLCAGRATPADLAAADASRERRAQIEIAARELIEHHGLPMKVLAVDHQRPTPAEELAVIYYTAPGRVDFRGLLSDLGRVLRCRLDLRQVGDRDAARLMCDVGACGRDACCTTRLKFLTPATEPLAPNSPVGACGRSMCCLNAIEPDLENARAT